MSTIDQTDVNAGIELDGEYLQNALNHFSQLNDDLQRQVLGALEARAVMWEKKAKLSQELEDALLIIKYDCDNTSAYLRAAKVYAIQGKQQDAIDMLEHALNSSPNDEQKELIQQQITIAKARLDRRIDFITQAPFEIASNIIGRIGYDDKIKEPMNVSESWRSMMLQCPEPWESSIYMKYASDWLWKKPFTLQELIPLISHHIKRLVVYYSPRVELIIEFIKVCNFSRLKYLKIYESSDNPCLYNPLYSTLGQVGHTLKEFELDARRVIIHIGKLLSSCPNLSSLKLNMNEIIDWHDGIPNMTLLENIKFCSRKRLSSRDLESLFRCSPHLRYARLSRQHDDEEYDILTAIRDHCPQLSCFYNGYYWENLMFRYKLLENDDAPDESDIPGLQKLSLINVRSTIPLRQRLEESSNSMRKIHIKPFNDGLNSIIEDWAPLASSTMPNVTYLGIIADLGSAIYQHLPVMLRAYPALRTLCLCGKRDNDVPAEVTDQIFDTVGRLTNLTSLSLMNILANGQGLHRLIHHYTNQEHPIMKELSLAYLNVDHALLLDVARIKSLQRIIIRVEDSEAIPESDTVEFSRLIAQLPELTDLDLYDIDLTKKATEFIASSQSLKRLDLVDCGQQLDDDAYEDVCHLFAHIPR
ncbi:hypothetical protein BJV82DRAFT_575196 [Fennellomyces sp. T-0311]|nr:hypothetical protein BJV82DRAFT_575196 [Fennellomyces sp. T-0311]